MKSPKAPLMFTQQQNSLSRIIREQGLTYSEDVFDQDILLDFKSIANPKKEKKKVQKLQNLTKLKSQTSQDSSPTKDSKSKQGLTKRTERDQYLGQKVQNYRRDNSPMIQIKSAQKKRNIIDLSDAYSEQKPIKKEKKDKITMDQQKTKKIQFQDLDRPKQEMIRKKQHSSTKIKQKVGEQSAIDSWKQGVLEICSNQSSDVKEPGKMSSLQQILNKNYKLISQQIRQMMAIVKWQYIELEKIELRKILSKLESQIRRMKIGFRGLSQSTSTENKGLSSKVVSKSKIKQLPHSKQKLKNWEQVIQKGQSTIEKQKSNKLHQLPAKEYGFDPFQIQISRDFQGKQNDKLGKLGEEIEKQKRLYAKQTFKYNQVNARYKKAKQETEIWGNESQLKEQIKVSNSVIKRSKILKEKIVFLKNQIKQTKLFYSNRIKRLKNQNSILYNETKYVEKQIQDIRTALANQESYNKNVSLAAQATVHKRPTLEQSRQPKTILGLSSATKTTTSHRQMISIKSVQSIQNVKSAQSINSFRQYQSYKSEEFLPKAKKIQSVDKQSKQYQLNQKHKLKINSPHLAPMNSGGNIKNYSILTKRKRDTEQRIGRSGQNSSLDVAFKKLQQKYQVQVQQPNCQSDYYYGSR